MIRFARTCESVAAVSSTREKAALVAAYLRTLDDADLEAGARFFTGNPFAQRDQRALNLGGSAIISAARNVWGFEGEELSRAYREYGDLGAALAELVRPPLDLGLHREPLTPASLKAIFDEIAAASGKSSSTRRIRLCERILGTCTERIEVKYVVKIMTGDLRIGLREGLVVDAIASAFDEASADVRRAVRAAGDIGSIAVAAHRHELEGVRIVYGSPVGFMLASPVAFGSTYNELRDGEWIVEDKFDGIRVQAHKERGDVRLFSRTLNDVSHSYPEVVAALRTVAGDFILDGELIAQRGGRVLPFRYLQARLQRKEVTDELLDEVPVTLMCFDLLAEDQTYLLDEPLRERRTRLESLVLQQPHLMRATWQLLEAAPAAERIQVLFEDARARGHEGLLFKRADSPYHPGRRGKWWLKLKRELSTLDVVVVAVEWGHGKRAKVLSDYTFAVCGGDGDLLTIGKAYSGLTDAEIGELTPWFLGHRLSAAHQRTNARVSEIPVEPKVVLEVAFDIIQKSDLHDSGFSLRFPRIVRIRDDKPASEIDTIDRVIEIYNEMLSREGVNH